ncbi:succinyl-CoA:3-ketoacid coenzyme A transferase 2 [Striga asiatica]|uniref:Succinyl-CoA:3-ketoacid coenzyme A transferase 2 n=1 Tax=Striga asiatica TaxID=4170 RepID=A0A5A7Q5Q4_STRAF|nr:succinyl-CoA:3-ketoacid coenzyme A transferase 2 [Striga asiatica]
MKFFRSIVKPTPQPGRLTHRKPPLSQHHSPTAQAEHRAASGPGAAAAGASDGAAGASASAEGSSAGKSSSGLSAGGSASGAAAAAAALGGGAWTGAKLPSIPGATMTNGALELGINWGTLHGRAEEDPVRVVDHVEEPLLVICRARGLVEVCEDVVVALELVELEDVEVVEDDVGAEDTLDYVFGLPGELAEVGVGEGEDGNCAAAVDDLSQVGLGEEGVELGEVGILFEDAVLLFGLVFLRWSLWLVLGY